MAHLRLCLIAILQGKFEELFTSLGVVCSSWIVTSRGSTGRSFINPMGNTAYQKVFDSNVMVSRTGYLVTSFAPVSIVVFKGHGGLVH